MGEIAVTQLLSNVVNTLAPDTILEEEAVVEKVIYNKSHKTLKIVLLPKKIIHKNKLEALKINIKSRVTYIQDITFHTIYKDLNLTPEEIIDFYWENILFEISKINLSSIAWLKDSIRKIDKESVCIFLNSQIGLEKLTEKKIDLIIHKILKDEFNINFKISLIHEEDKSGYNHQEYLLEKDKEANDLIKNIMIETEKNTDKRTKKYSEQNQEPILGKKIKDDAIAISMINEESGIATIEGEIFAVESKELKNGKLLFSISITDYNESIACKVFLKKDQYDSFSFNIVAGNFIKVKGEVRYDTFSKEIIVYASDINLVSPVIRSDNAKIKRVELHVHTNMSAMDGVASTDSIIKRAAQWGHKAIAITDHGVAQAYPDAMIAGKKYGIKVIYGIEGYLVNDGDPIVINSNNKNLDQSYVIFDLETTGLSSKYNHITEIGAVKIENSKIVDRFHTLINPKIKIPKNIVELTGITDEMVRNQPAIEEILHSFVDFIGDCPIVAHNASFDTSFLFENCRRLDIQLNNTIIDTLALSKILLPHLKRYRLNNIAEELDVKLLKHHRAIDDAEALTEIFTKFLELIKNRGINQLDQLNYVFSQNIDTKKLDTYHIIILVKNYIGLKNLYKIISSSHIDTFYKKPRIPKSLLKNHREGLIFGTACEAGELYKAILLDKPKQELEAIIKFYDYFEIQPLDNNKFLINKGLVNGIEDLKEINRKILELGDKHNKPVIATGDVHFLNSQDEIYRRILMAGQGFDDSDDQAPLYLRTTDEMLTEFEYLGKEAAERVVVENTNIINSLIEEIIPIPDDTFPPIIEGSDDNLKEMCFKKAYNIYGNPLPEIVHKRLDRELSSIISNGYAVMYIIAQKLVTKSLQDGYLVGSRGSVGSSIVATMSDITEVNPLPPHYICKSCKHSEFISDDSIGSGIDLRDKNCPICGTNYDKDGHDIPFEVFLGFEGDKEPDIDLNFAGEYQMTAHKYTEELFGKGYVFRAGTIGTIADKTAYGFVKKYFEGKGMSVNNREIDRLSRGCTGVRRTTGQHPGGVMVVPNYKDIYEFCPIQYPANDKSSGTITTHFDYHAISGRLLKLDILGHDVPTIIKMLQDITGVDPTLIRLDDKETMKIFTSLKPLKLVDEDFKYEVGSLGIPEFGTKFVRQMLIDTRPTTFAELVRISGLSHGTDVWINNAQDLVKQKIAELTDVISTRDDIMNFLIHKDIPPKSAFKIMENVRKGKGLSIEDEKLMKQYNVPQWYIESCNKIKYMFPKAHAAAYVMMSFRIAYFKVHYPLAFYATYFTTKAADFDAELVLKGKDKVKNKIEELEKLGNSATQKEKDSLTVLEVVLEMYCRGFGFLPVNIYKSDSVRFFIEGLNLLPPLIGLQGVGENAARSITNSRKDGMFVSIEDLRQRTKINKTTIEALVNHGCVSDLPATNQLSLF